MAMNIGTRVSLSPRSAPALSTWMPSGSWNAAAYSSRIAASEATARSSVYSRTTALWPSSSTVIDSSWVTSTIATPAQTARRTPSPSWRPTAWPTRTVVASPTPIGIMKHSCATLIAIWCAAASVAPMRPISSAVTMNTRLPSAR
jgi:hypothetical protein